MLQEPGRALDTEVARRLADASPEVPPYSTKSDAADDLISRLEKAGLYATCERSGKLWHCVISIEAPRARERLASGTGATRPLALCRAILNLPEGALNRPPPR